MDLLEWLMAEALPGDSCSLLKSEKVDFLNEYEASRDYNLRVSVFSPSNL
jgi:hypothetical protein